MSADHTESEAAGDYRSSLSPDLSQFDHHRLYVFDFPPDANGNYLVRKWFDYEPMEGEFYYDTISPDSLRLFWTKEVVSDAE